MDVGCQQGRRAWGNRSACSHRAGLPSGCSEACCCAAVQLQPVPGIAYAGAANAEVALWTPRGAGRRPACCITHLLYYPHAQVTQRDQHLLGSVHLPAVGCCELPRHPLAVLPPAPRGPRRRAGRSGGTGRTPRARQRSVLMPFRLSTAPTEAQAPQDGCTATHMSCPCMREPRAFPPLEAQAELHLAVRKLIDD